LAHCLAARGDRNGRMNGAKVDEVMCKTLKPHSSDTRFNDVVIKGYNLYFPSNEGSNLRMMPVRAETGTTEHVVTRWFESAPHAHYIPKWSEQNDPYEYSGLEVYMASKKNYEFNVKKQSEAKLVKLGILSMESWFEYGDVQTLLNKNHFLAMKEPILFVADYLGIEPPQLVKAMSTFELTSGGWLATVNETLMNTLSIEKGFLPILKTKVNRRPLIGMKQSDSQLRCYKTEGMAVWAILLHILFNMRMQFRDHWCKKLLENTKDFTLLLPISPTLE
jgi:hypothetical protein